LLVGSAETLLNGYDYYGVSVWNQMVVLVVHQEYT
jgi:hypothetical protein